MIFVCQIYSKDDVIKKMAYGLYVKNFAIAIFDLVHFPENRYIFLVIDFFKVIFVCR